MPRSQVRAAQHDFAARLLLAGETEADVLTALCTTFRMRRTSALQVIDGTAGAATAP